MTDASKRFGYMLAMKGQWRSGNMSHRSEVGFATIDEAEAHAVEWYGRDREDNSWGGPEKLFEHSDLLIFEVKRVVGMQTHRTSTRVEL